MRNTILFFVLLVLAACGKDQVKISGHILNADSTMLYLDEVNVYDILPVDSMTLRKRGNFSFNIKSKEPGFYQLRLSPNQVILLFPKPGQRIKIHADANNLLPSLSIEGSHDTEQLAKMIFMLNNTRAKLDSLSRLAQTATQDSTLVLLNQEYNNILEMHRKSSIAYLLTHSNSLSSLYVLYQQYQPDAYVFYKTTDIQFFKIVSDSLSKYHPGSKHVTALKAYTKNLIDKYNTNVIIQKGLMKGAALPRVALPDVTGDTVTLQSLKGKVVLLSFWVSEHDASVRQNLELKKIYEKYKSRGFEIMQVSFDRSEANWIKAVRFDELPWISVIDNTYPNSSVAGNFNVTAVPANFLIERDNVTIMARNLTTAQLSDRLEEMLKK
ncbi:MAG: AhpC/TSA family protein [Bacteroidales bacterium]|nr:AhpC/TSA family protein [Bacteroidales bacterium]